jgi:F-type H+-transporting ATPase subunit epsilon
MAKIKLDIITPERLLFQREVNEVQIPTQNGEIGILPGHTPIISQLAITGLLKYRDDSSAGQAVIGNGFVEVSNDKVTILASLAELPGEINLETARKELESAERVLKSAEKDPNVDVSDALVKVERAAIRIQAAQGK